MGYLRDIFLSRFQSNPCPVIKETVRFPDRVVRVALLLRPRDGVHVAVKARWFTHLVGDLDDPDSAPSVAVREKNGFKLLEERNTQPRVTYLGSPFSSGAREIERPSVRE